MSSEHQSNGKISNGSIPSATERHCDICGKCTYSMNVVSHLICMQWYFEEALSEVSNALANALSLSHSKLFEIRNNSKFKFGDALLLHVSIYLQNNVGFGVFTHGDFISASFNSVRQREVLKVTLMTPMMAWFDMKESR